MYGCGSEAETTKHFLLLLELFQILEKVYSSFLKLNDKDKVSF